MTPPKKKKEHFLLTRKTFRFMSDAGRKLIPEGNTGETEEDLAKIEENFQNICKQEKAFLVRQNVVPYDSAPPSSPGSPPPPSLSIVSPMDDGTESYDNQYSLPHKEGYLSPFSGTHFTFPPVPQDQLGGDLRYAPSPRHSPLYQGDPFYGSAYSQGPQVSSAPPFAIRPGAYAGAASGIRSMSSPSGSQQSYMVSPGAQGSYPPDAVSTPGPSHSPRRISVTSGVRDVGRFPGSHLISGSPAASSSFDFHSSERPSSIQPLCSSAPPSLSNIPPPRTCQGVNKSVQTVPIYDLDSPEEEGGKGKQLPSLRSQDKRNSESLSESTLETIRRYFKLVRGNSKSEKEKKDRFKKVNYDRNLRFIKSKNCDEICMDEGNSKSSQVDEQFLDPMTPESKTRKTSETASSSERSNSEGPGYTVTVCDNMGMRELTYPQDRASPRSSIDSCDDEVFTTSPPVGFSSSQTMVPPQHLMAQLPSPYYPSTPLSSVSSPVAPSMCGIPEGQVPPSMYYQAPFVLHSPQPQQAGPDMSPKQSVSISCPQTPASSRTSPSTVQQLSNMLSSAVIGRGPQPGGRLGAKKIWRTRSKSQSRASAHSTCTWTPLGGGAWSSVTGRVLSLTDSHLMSFTELERLTLQQSSLARLQALNLGCSINIPKEMSVSSGKTKRRAHLLKKRSLTTSFFESQKRDEREPTSGQVFGVPLSRCIELDRRRQHIGSPLREVYTAPNLSRKNSRASCISFSGEPRLSRQGTESMESLERLRGALVPLAGSTGQLDSLSVESVDTEGGAETGQYPQAPLIPQLVSACIKHLETHGLRTLGLFRVSSAKKRVRQLREEFDAGAEVKLNEEHCPHDVATLLKEYLRDLPEPLLTRDLYQAFINTQKIRNRRKQLEALQQLTCLLPPPNRDTLWAILSFLRTVADNANDVPTASGEVLPGNKMDSTNLATVIAPNILHTVKAGKTRELTPEATARATERVDVISVIRCMIDHTYELFQVSGEQLDEIYHRLLEKHPGPLDQLLRNRAQNETDEELDMSGNMIESAEFIQQQQPSIEPEESKTVVAPPRQRNSREEEQPRWFRRRNRRSEDSEAQDRRRPRRERQRLASTDSEMLIGIVKSESADEVTIRSMQRPQKSPSESLVAENKTRIRGTPTKPEEQRTRIVQQEIEVRKTPNTTRKSSVPGLKSQRDTLASRKRSGSDQSVSTSEQEGEGRRLSAPSVDNTSVITASLKIPVPLSKHGHSSSTFALNLDDTDIPFIEDNNGDEDAKNKLRGYSDKRHQSSPYIPEEHYSDPQTASVHTTKPLEARQRSGSNDSYLGQPITGSMTFQPIQKTGLSLKQSQDSALSTGSSMDIASSCSLRNTPSSDLLCVSGHSTPLSTPSPQPWRSDSSVPSTTDASVTVKYKPDVSPVSHSTSDASTAGKYKTDISPTSPPKETMTGSLNPDASTIVPTQRTRASAGKPKQEVPKTRPELTRGTAIRGSIPDSKEARQQTKLVRSRYVSKDAQRPIDLQKSASVSIGATNPTISKETKVPVPRQRTSIKKAEGEEPRSRVEAGKSTNPSSSGTEVSKSRSTSSIPSTERARGKKYSRVRHETSHIPQVEGEGPPMEPRGSIDAQHSTVWKRWEIIASDPNSPETFV